jgi:glycosyltransferase involved in cell wall biosynthesis
VTTAEIRSPKPGTDNGRYQLRAAGLVDELCVVIPAHNEQRLLEKCLHTLHRARRELCRHLPQITCRIVVVADACNDRTADIATEMGATIVTAQHRNVGAARRDGVDTAIAQSASPVERLWLASTDADCQVPSGWLAHFAAAAASGYHLVAGMVCPTAELGAAELRAWQVRHPYVEGHPHIHGANLGVRADVYSRLGGWSPLQTGEDVELVTRAEQHPGLHILRSARFPVLTSARRVGRAPAGFADYLSTLREIDSGAAISGHQHGGN